MNLFFPVLSILLWPNSEGGNKENKDPRGQKQIETIKQVRLKHQATR